VLRLVLLLAWLPAMRWPCCCACGACWNKKSNLVAPLLPNAAVPGRRLADPRAYHGSSLDACYNYFLVTELRFSMVLILLVGPNLISQDLRYNALPLYFSRPLRRIDYFLGKLGVIAAFLAMVIIVPSLTAYALGLLFSLDLSIVRDTFGLLLASIAYGLVIALSAGLLILALSSLSRNSRYIALFWLAIWFVSSAVAGILESVDQQQRRQHFAQAAQREFAQAAQRGPGAAHQGPAMNFAFEDFVNAERDAAKTNWRPLVSYTGNLSRVGQQMLGTDACWEKFSQLQPPGQRGQFLLAVVGPQYPWYWSAAVLAGLFGLSACILKWSIKSLDRLK
jgi:ABC-2 type transport system permease protein